VNYFTNDDTTILYNKKIGQKLLHFQNIAVVHLFVV